jgi:SAM-dependent methyltransferase
MEFIKKIMQGKEVDQYLASGRIPWSPGYKQYRYGLLSAIPGDKDLLALFANGGQLPACYGVGVDERIVEYPWLFSRLSLDGGLILDGGSVLNYPYLIDSPQLSRNRLVILTLAPESTMEKRQNVSYMFGDLRETIFRDNAFDAIVSISTLEHIGMDNAKLYTSDSAYIESTPEDYLKVIREFHRILKPGGKFFMTVPYGKPQNLGWLYQFDMPKIDRVVSVFGDELRSLTFYQYSAKGWNVSDETSAAECEYYDVHSASVPAEDLAAAARAVACLEFVKNA